MGALYICGCCGSDVGLNGFTSYREKGYCPYCGIDDLRKAVAAAKYVASELGKADCRIGQLNAELGAARLIQAALEGELEKLRPKPIPCVRCRCAACEQSRALAQTRSGPYHCYNPWGGA